MAVPVDAMGGGQFQQAIAKIMEAESKPIRQSQAHKANVEARLKLHQEFKTKFSAFDTALAEFTNLSRFREYKVDLGDGQSQISVSIDKTKVAPGSYELEVVQLANPSAIMSNGFESADDPVLGMGYVVAQKADGTTEEIFVPASKASLNGISNLINSDPDRAIRATVAKDSGDPDAPFRLILTSKKDGMDDEVIFPQFYFLDADKDIRIQFEREASNAVIKLNGFEMETDGNQINDFLTGVNLNLKQAQPGKPFSLQVTEDVPKVTLKVKGLIDQINGVLEFINKQNQVDEKSDTRNTFAGDTSLQNIEYRLRNLVHEGFPSWGSDKDAEPRIVFLNEMGIEIAKNGQLAFNEQKFTQTIEKDFKGVSDAITGEYGFAQQLRFVMANYTRPGNGFLALRENNLRGQIAKVERDMEFKQRLLDRKQESLVAQFSKLQSTLSGMQQQQGFLQASLGSSGSNPIAQLLGG